MSGTIPGRVLGAALAIFVSFTAILSIGYGLLGIQGNSTVTGLILVTLLIVILSLSARYYDSVAPVDLLFFSLVLVAGASTVINEGSSSPRELLLFCATFAAYVACRPISMAAVDELLPSFKRAIAILVAIGTILTAATILKGNDAGINSGKAFVLGFNSLPTQLLMAFSFLILGLVTSNDPTPRRTTLISALIFLPIAVLAAAMVRFTFIALGASLLLALVLSEKGKRWHVAVVMMTVVAGIGVGLLARMDMAKIYIGQVSEAGHSDAACPTVNMSNSIEIRRFLIQEALSKLPQSGPLGTGLDSLMNTSCISGHFVHNSALQMTVEMGWLGGALFLTLAGVAITGLWLPALRYSQARFVLCSLVFALLVSLAHGRVSRDITLFGFLGCAAGVTGASKRPRVPGAMP